MMPESQTPESTPPPPVPEKAPNELERLTGVFFSPRKVFPDIARRPRWWIPVLIMGVLSTIFIQGYSQRVGWERLIRQQLDRSSQTGNLSAEQRERAIVLGAGVAKIVGYAAVVGTLFAIFVTAVVLFFLINTLMGANIRFGGMMGIVSYAFLPLALVTILSMVVMYQKPPEDFDLRNPLAFNAGVFVASDAMSWVKALAASFDLFSFWVIALLAAGISSAAPKISFAKALFAVIFPWALFVALKTANTAAFG
ncbi:MAG TPA: Yip1 family protein [Bryobacteraceae bacterium]